MSHSHKSSKNPTENMSSDGCDYEQLAEDEDYRTLSKERIGKSDSKTKSKSKSKTKSSSIKNTRLKSTSSENIALLDPERPKVKVKPEKKKKNTSDSRSRFKSDCKNDQKENLNDTSTSNTFSNFLTNTLFNLSFFVNNSSNQNHNQNYKTLPDQSISTSETSLGPRNNSEDTSDMQILNQCNDKPYVVNIINSIIGVAILAIASTFKDTGIL